MSGEANYLVTLCRAYLENEKLTLDSGIDYDVLYLISNRHNLSAVAFSVINVSENKDIVPATVFKEFENDFFESFVRYGVQSRVQAELDSVLSKNEILHVFFKGAEIKEYFPIPETRVMGDIDVLIKPGDRDRVKALIPKLGFKCVSSNGPVYNYEKDNALIEMHTKIISGKVGSSTAEKHFEDAIDHAEFSGYAGTLDVNYHFAYLIAHIAHHFWFYGAGLKLILDLAVMLKSCEINTDEVLSILDGAGLADFARVMLTLCKKWFGVGADFGLDTEKTEAFLLSYGAFGNVNRNNAAVIERKELEEGKKAKGFSTKLRLLFPSYEKLKYIDYLKFIEGRPYLTPAAWIYRVWYNFKYRRSFVESSIKAIGSDETKGEAEKELAYFKEIGLL